MWILATCTLPIMHLGTHRCVHIATCIRGTNFDAVPQVGVNDIYIFMYILTTHNCGFCLRHALYCGVTQYVAAAHSS